MIAYRAGTPRDAAALDALFDASFTETFGHIYAPEDLAAFLAGFTLPDWERELADPAFALRIAETESGALAGYAKLGPVTLPVEPTDPATELRQLYVGRAWHGAGVARALMAWVIEESRSRGAAELYLSVFTENHRARAFYDRYGFEPIGPYAFMVGNHADEDVIMRKRL